MAFWGEAMTKNHPVWMEQDLGAARRILERLAPAAAARVAKGQDRARARILARGRDALRRRRQTGARPRLPGRDAPAPRRLSGRRRRRGVLWRSPCSAPPTTGRDTAIYMRAAAVLEGAFAAHPNHPGLAHYLIHSYDNPGARAARRCRRRSEYFTIAPAAPHALHMTSHIYLAIGMWDEVVAANEQATRDRGGTGAAGRPHTPAAAATRTCG